MIKNNVIALFILSLITAFFVSFAVSAPNKTNQKYFSGRVIFVADNYIELKKGMTELLVYFADNSKFIAKDGKDSTKDIITVCQYVDAYYTDGTKKILNKIIVKKESDCDK